MGKSLGHSLAEVLMSAPCGAEARGAQGNLASVCTGVFCVSSCCSWADQPRLKPSKQRLCFLIYCPARTGAESLHNPGFAPDLACLRVFLKWVASPSIYWIPAGRFAAGKPAAEPHLAHRTPWGLGSCLFSPSSKAEEYQLAPVLVRFV